MTEAGEQRILAALAALKVASEMHAEEAGAMRSAFASMAQGLQLVLEAIDRLSLGVAETNKAVAELRETLADDETDENPIADALERLTGKIEDMQNEMGHLPVHLAEAVGSAIRMAA